MRILLSKSGFPYQNADSMSTDINAFLSRVHIQTGIFICLSIPEKFLVFGIFVVDLSNFAGCASIWSCFWIPQRPADLKNCLPDFYQLWCGIRKLFKNFQFGLVIVCVLFSILKLAHLFHTVILQYSEV